VRGVFGPRDEREELVARRLTRDTRRAVLGGVAAGFGRFLDVDPVLARLGFVLLAFVNGLGILFYLACWLLMPGADAAETAESTAPATAGTGFEALREAGTQLAAGVRRGAPDPAAAQLAIGSLLVLIGAVLLLHNLGWLHWPHWMRFGTLWPLLLVALGVGLVVKARRPASS
jgi:phage shock protein PspC (stress-responsive transcriptional regulator)